MEGEILCQPEAVWVLEGENKLTRIKEETESDTLSDSEGASFDLKPVKKEFCENGAKEDKPEDGSAHTPDGGQDVCSKLEIEYDNILEDSSGCRQSPGLGGLQVRHKVAGSSVEAADHSVPDIEIPVQKESYKCHFCNMNFPRVADLVLHTKKSHTYWKETVHVQTIMEAKILCNPEAVWLLEDQNMLTLLKEVPELDTVSGSEDASFDLKPVKKEFCEGEAKVDEPEDGRAHTPGGGQDLSSTLDIEDNNILEDSSGCRQNPGLGGLHVRHKIAGSSVEAADHSEPDIEIPVQKGSYKCHFCCMGFSRVVDLVLHTKKSHMGEKSFMCELCKKCFRLRSDLKVHLTTHAGEKSFVCEHCKKHFRLRSDLNDHITAHAGEKPFCCERCNKCFTQRCGLIFHKRTHTGEKSFMCEHCKKYFRLRHDLNVHIKDHAGVKPFSCEHCNKCFTLRCGLIVHRRTHIEERYFKCGHCKKCFPSRYLNIHVRTHRLTRTKPFVYEHI